MSSSIKQNEKAITAEVKRAKNEEGKLSARIEVTADGIKTKVDKNGVISAINQTAETIEISASRINLSGYVTASQLEATNGRINSLVAGESAFTQIVTAGIRASAFRFVGADIETRSATINGTTIRYLGW